MFIHIFNKLKYYLPTYATFLYRHYSYIKRFIPLLDKASANHSDPILHVIEIKNTHNQSYKSICGSKKLVTYFCRYTDADTKRVVWKFKYYKNKQATSFLGDMLYDELVSHASKTAHAVHKKILLIHPPSTSFMKRLKDFDHMKTLLEHIDALDMGEFFAVCTHAVLPTISSIQLPHQHTSNKETRIMNSRDRFVLSEAFKTYICNTQPTHIYCIDDVVTTGSTLSAISELCAIHTHITPELFALCG